MKLLLPGTPARVGLLVAGLLALAPPASAQVGLINQLAVEELLAIRADRLEDVPQVYYEYYDLFGTERSGVRARNAFYDALGLGDLELGRKRARLIELINRTLLDTVRPGDTLVVPDTFDIDFRAFSPFPRYYEGARGLDKLFIIHKTVQAWAAYENGELARWGLVSTGDPKVSPTPTGRFNFNWKEPYRVSSLSPEDEQWEMYWVFNFFAERGIHVHQYDMPTDGPGSHGCVRLVDADARWIFDWAEPWQTSDGSVGYDSVGKPIKRQGSPVLVLGADPVGKPDLFVRGPRYPEMIQVELPEDPMSVPGGSEQQKFFDRQREKNSDGTYRPRVAAQASTSSR